MHTSSMAHLHGSRCIHKQNVHAKNSRLLITVPCTIKAMSHPVARTDCVSTIHHVLWSYMHHLASPFVNQSSQKLQHVHICTKAANNNAIVTMPRRSISHIPGTVNTTTAIAAGCSAQASNEPTLWSSNKPTQLSKTSVDATGSLCCAGMQTCIVVAVNIATYTGSM
jgi:hypothetical protein